MAGVDKTRLLNLLNGLDCPICGHPKERQQWTCTPCYRPLRETREHQALSDLCDQHLLAADAFLKLAKAAYQPASE